MNQIFTASPTIDGNFYDGQNLELELNIPDTYNQVAKVEFFSDASNKLAEFVEPPYQLTISKISGTATYTALVIYQSGATKTLKKAVECLPLPPLLEDAVLKANYPSISFAYADIRAIMEDNTSNIDSRMATFTSYFADDFVDMSGAASKVDLETTTKSRLERYAINSYEFYPISHIEMASAGSTGTDTIKVTTKIDMEFEFASLSDYAVGSNSYKFELTSTADEKFLISEERKYVSKNWRSYGSPTEESRLRDERNEKTMNGQWNGVGHFVYESISNWMVYHFHDTSAFSPMRRSEIVEDYHKLRGDASNITPFLLHLKNHEFYSDHYQRIVDAVCLVISFFDDFRLDVQKLGEVEKPKLLGYN